MSVKILIGDVREQLREMPDESVHCVVTSPPYWGLRCYGVDGQIGQEPTLGEHVEVMVEVFREVRRVLRKDGTVWLNYGDCYATQIGKGGNVPQTKHPNNSYPAAAPHRSVRQPGLKPKDLCMMPARVALALQADGWWLRSEIIWVKPNPMPESITDRPTSSHEKIYLLARSERYYFDADAVKEPYTDVSMARLSQPNFDNQTGGPKDPMTGNRSHKKALNNQREKLVRQEKWKTRYEGWKDCEKLGRNIRNVWTVATAPFPGAHFATFPPALIEPCIKAGTSEKGCCPECGAPWVREVERTPMEIRDAPKSAARRAVNRTSPSGTMTKAPETRTLGWRPSCDCGLAEVPCTVLDIFGGAGTTGLVADRLKRNGILIELNPEYAAMARARIQADGGMFARVLA